MNQSSKIEGNYTREGNKIFNDHLTFVISNRPNPKPYQPPKILLLKGNPDKHISGLFPIKGIPNRYSFDYEGEYYTLDIFNNAAIISKRQTA